MSIAFKVDKRLVKLYMPISVLRSFRREKSIIRGSQIVGTILNYNFIHHYINKTSYETLKLCDGEHSLSDIINNILGKYTGPRHKIIADIINFIKIGLDNGFISFDKNLKNFHQPLVDESSLSSEYLDEYLYSPITVYFEVTYACNLRCIHCYASAGKPLENELSFNEISKLIDELVAMKVFYVALGGGEPLLREDIVKIVNSMVSKGIHVSLATNGTLFDWDIAEELWDRGLRDVQFSLDGATADVHDKIRGVKGSFEKVIRAIKIAKTIGYNVTIKPVVQRRNWQHIPKIMELVAELGVDGYNVSRTIPYGRARENFKDIFLPYENYSNIVKAMEQLYSSKISGSLRINYEPIIDIGRERSIAPKDVKVGCPAGFTSVHICPDGTVKPCSYFPDKFNCGNIRESSLQEVWLYSPILQILRSLRLSDLKEPCRSCKLPCSGRCRGAATALFEDIYAPDPLCPIVEGGLNLEKLEELSKLEHGLNAYHILCRRFECQESC